MAGSLPGYRSAVTASAGERWRNVVGSFGDFRNDVMHPVRDFAQATQAGMRNLAKFERRALALTLATEALLSTGSQTPAETDVN